MRIQRHNGDLRIYVYVLIPIWQSESFNEQLQSSKICCSNSLIIVKNSLWIKRLVLSNFIRRCDFLDFVTNSTLKFQSSQFYIQESIPRINLPILQKLQNFYHFHRHPKVIFYNSLFFLHDCLVALTQTLPRFIAFIIPFSKDTL